VGAREDILAALRRASPPPVPRPDLSGVGVRYPDPIAQLEQALAAAGGVLQRVPDLAAADRCVRALPQARGAKRIVSLVPGVGAPTVDLAAITDPHQFEGVDLAILSGDLAVAENGAVWIDRSALPHHALVVVPEHLAVVVPASAVVHDMHEAYARVALGAAPRFGLFLAGPSKTADIEQSLVIGAHGARSCTVLLVGER
jgi:L-lactate dehydrogenase complex protein LldG